MDTPTPLARRGVVRRVAPATAEGDAGAGEAVVAFTASGCAGCGFRSGGTAPTLRIGTGLPEGTVVDVHVDPRRLLAQTARVFVPPLAVTVAAVAAFADAPSGGALVVAGLLLGMAAAIAAGWLRRRRRPERAAESVAIAVRPVGANTAGPTTRLGASPTRVNAPAAD